MTKKTGAYLVMIAGVILLIFNISELDFGNFKNGPFFGIISNVLLILAMVISINDLKKKENKKQN